MTDQVAAVTLAAQNFPPNTPTGPVVVKLLAADNSVVASQSLPTAVDATAVSATFASVNPGTYTISAERQDGNGAAIAPAVVSLPFTVDAVTPVTITVPASVLVAASG